jgi:cellulose biosynthesis protein BcsQ
MKLLVSTDAENIKKLKEKNIDIALSKTSAQLKLNTRKYDTVIKDNIDIRELNFDNVIDIKDYIKDYKTDIKPFKQEIISVYSQKGGLGKTTLVKKFSESFPKVLKVLIIDLNFSDGGSDLSYMLNLPVIPHIGTYLKERSKKSFIENLVHYKDNIYVMQSPPKISLINDMTEKDIADIITIARSEFDIILLDLPNNKNSFVMTALEQSTKIVVLSSGYPSELKRIKENLNGLNYVVVFKKPVRGYSEIADTLNMPYIKVNDFIDSSYILSQVLRGDNI